MSDFKVIPYGTKWAVQKPDGLIRCVVSDKNFALSIAHDCSLTDLPGGTWKPVLCIETGDVFESASKAAKVAGCKSANTIVRACYSGRKVGGWHWKLLHEENENGM